MMNEFEKPVNFIDRVVETVEILIDKGFNAVIESKVFTGEIAIVFDTHVDPTKLNNILRDKEWTDFRLAYTTQYSMVRGDLSEPQEKTVLHLLV